MYLFFMPSNEIHNLLINFFWNKSFMLLHFLEVPIACFSNYGTFFFCLKSVLSVDEMVSMLIAFFFMFKQCFCFVQQLLYVDLRNWQNRSGFLLLPVCWQDAV